MNYKEQGVCANRPEAKPRFSDRCAQSLSKYWYIVVIGWLCTSIISFAGYSRQKPLWGDEILFRLIATGPSLRDIWRGLLLGVNIDPPFAHVIAHGLILIFGSGPLAVRLPAIAGLSALMLFLALTLQRVAGGLYALVALVLPFCTMLRDYGYEARPYGLMYGCIGFAIYCWTRAGERNGRKWNLCLGLALTAALGCHFYGVFVLPAFFLGEIVRTRRRGRVSWPSIVAMAAASATLLFYLPIMEGAHRFSSAYFAKPVLGSVPAMLQQSLSGLLIPSLVFLSIAVARPAVFGLGAAPDENGEDSRLGELGALAVGLTLIPVIGWMAAELVLKAYTDRYVLHGAIGVCLLIPLFSSQIFRSNRRLGLVLVLAFGSWALFGAAVGTLGLFRPVPQNAEFAELVAGMPELNGDIIVSNPFVFKSMIAYSPVLKERCVSLFDRGKELQSYGVDTGALISASAGQMGYYRAENWTDYAKRDQPFLLLTVPDNDSDRPGWLRDYLRSVNRLGRVVRTFGHYILVEVKPA